MSGLGDYPVSTIIYGKFSTFRPSTGAAYTLGGTPALSVYKDNSTTQSTSGVTLTVDFDGVTGLHHFAIDTSADGSFYSAGSNFDIVITTGTVDSVSVVGAVVGSFSIDKANDVNVTTVAGTTQTAGDLKASISALNNLSAAQVNTEVLDVLTVDTFAEPSSVPAATSTLKDKINWMFSLARNKGTQTSTTKTLRNDADSADIGTSTISDDGTTFTRGEWV